VGAAGVSVLASDLGTMLLLKSKQAVPGAVCGKVDNVNGL